MRADGAVRAADQPVGGLFMPPPGPVADHYGPRGALVVLASVTVIATVVSMALREPASAPEPPKDPQCPGTAQGPDGHSSLTGSSAVGHGSRHPASTTGHVRRSPRLLRIGKVPVPNDRPPELPHHDAHPP
ncbi:hypothetical protein GCM10009564_42940 [Streptomyces thermogriseus]|uniref:Uncharacterized protein n=1 Tax=Streptomyces thermogriseus TaxID=75292 RepID=A0ABP4DMN7_9ACTN